LFSSHALFHSPFKRSESRNWKLTMSSSRERYAVQPINFPMGRKRKPSPGFRCCNCSSITETCTGSDH
jgi:hypothetical protein